MAYDKISISDIESRSGSLPPPPPPPPPPPVSSQRATNENYGEEDYG
jgi:hypothetical protein